MTYFTDIHSLEELRKEYKRLVKANHPDNGGSEDAIKVINVEYEITFKVLAKADTTNARKYDMAADEQIREIINIIINFDINIEICGSWIWVSGNTYGCKNELKANGFHWASKKKCGTGTIQKNRQEVTEKPQWMISAISTDRKQSRKR